ncbi:hypothetical protein Goklo_011766, partial [Gossypium klotzschianum]|nr:hypothetical protein [Gossypium klotzschianum]
KLFRAIKWEAYVSHITGSSYEPIIGKLIRAINGKLKRAKYLEARGVLRDEWRKWIMGFNRRLGRCTIFEAKLWGILDGLSLLQGRKCDRVLMPTYSLEVIEAIKEFNSKNSNSALI